MLAVGRALMARPKLLLLDEPSLGLAPLLAEQIFDAIAQLKRDGITQFLVEQNASAALSIADRRYVMETGSIVLREAAASSWPATASIRRIWAFDASAPCL
jgi:branched-chain amino acid transport system ATP-binding protein